MELFRLEAECEFEAIDLLDAFKRVAEHFNLLAEAMEEPGAEGSGKPFLRGGTLEVRSVDNPEC